MIRQATIADVELIAELEMALFDNALSVAMVERELKHGQGFLLGDYAYALVRRDGELHDLTRLGVMRSHQGMGAGRRLLQYVVSMGRSVCLTVKKDNERALALYRANGFRIIGHFSAECAWAMLRESSSPSLP